MYQQKYQNDNHNPSHEDLRGYQRPVPRQPRAFTQQGYTTEPSNRPHSFRQRDRFDNWDIGDNLSWNNHHEEEAHYPQEQFSAPVHHHPPAHLANHAHDYHVEYRNDEDSHHPVDEWGREIRTNQVATFPVSDANRGQFFQDDPRDYVSPSHQRLVGSFIQILGNSH